MTATMLKEALTKLKEHNIRITPQRHAVLEYLISCKSHPTVDEIYRALEDRFPNMSVATIYNNLKALKEVGLVKELTYGDSSSRFDFHADEHEHYHVVCENCKRIVDIEIPSLESLNKLAEEVSQFKHLHHRIEFYGICPDCFEKK